MRYIAIMGYGIVGGGITRILENNRKEIRETVGDDVDVRYILDLREFPDSPYADRIIHTISPILEDSSVELVCEAMGGSHPAYEFTKMCMESGKSVVTSNKEVVAKYGDELLRLAEKRGVKYLFEASVGGGIPIIRALNTSLAQEKITGITGIVNGTTNYILCKMKEEGSEFREALAEAQRLGYAEKDPSADIDSIDSKRKIIILTAMATGKLIPEEAIYSGTTRNIEKADLLGAEKAGAVVKLIVFLRINGENMTVFTCPAFVGKELPLSAVNGVYNAVSVTSDKTGDLMFYGQGAGRLPTAGAVVADVCAVLSGAACKERVPVFNRISCDDGNLTAYYDYAMDHYVRCGRPSGYVTTKFPGSEIISEADGVTEAVISDAVPRDIREKLGECVYMPFFR